MGRPPGSEPRGRNSSLHRPKKRKLKEADVVVSNKLHTSDKSTWTINKLPDDLLVDILSRLPVKEAARSSVLSRRWRNLWKYTYGTLEFDAWPNYKGTEMNAMKFRSVIDHVLKLHKGSRIDAFIVRFNLLSGVKCHTVDRWIHFAMRKQLKVFELRLALPSYAATGYMFPNIEELSLHSHDFKSLSNSLTTLRLIGVKIMDSVLHWFLASCPNLEHLCISVSGTTKNVRIIDPLPKLKSLEISGCRQIESMEISVASLISFTYAGKAISIPFKNTPNLSELTLGGNFCDYFIREPNKHTGYSGQLVKLVLDLADRVPHEPIIPADIPEMHSLKHLEVKSVSDVGYRLYFFTLLIEKAPVLQEFKLKINYMFEMGTARVGFVPFPEINSGLKFCHETLKVLEIAGFVGCTSEKKFLKKLSRRAPFLELVVIDTRAGYEDGNAEPGVRRRYEILPGSWKERLAKQRVDAKEAAENMRSILPPNAKMVIV